MKIHFPTHAPDGASIVAASVDDLWWCCDGASIYGPERCTCWQPVFDHEGQAEPSTGEHAGVQRAMCHDCAYRPDAPEDREHMDDLVTAGHPFWCHYGLRRVIGWTHPAVPDFVLPAGPGDYRPPVVDGRPYQVDGTPGRLCAGWVARRLRAMWTPRAGD